MAEMLVKSESLTSIADKIRVLKGTTESMSLDDMETELGTVDNAVTAALSALVEKGVEVPDGTNVTGLAELIEAIETTEEVTTVSGTITPASETQVITIEHNLGKIPQYFLLFRSNGIYDSGSATDKVAFPATAAQTVLSVILAGGKLFYVCGWYSAGEHASIRYKKIDDIDSPMYFNYITINESIISFELIDSTSVFRTKKYVWEAMG